MFTNEGKWPLHGFVCTGKTTFVNVIASGQFNEDMIPTVGFNMRKITKGNVTIKLWDIGGQPRFRSMWERYCRGVNAIVYMVDAADPDKIEASRNELHNLLDRPQLAGIPILVLGNKRDLPGEIYNYSYCFMTRILLQFKFDTIHLIQFKLILVFLCLHEIIKIYFQAPWTRTG